MEASAIAQALQRLGHEVVMVGSAVDLVDRLAAGQRFDVVFNACRAAMPSSSAALVSELLNTFGMACTFSSSTTLNICNQRGAMKSLLRDRGIPTSDYWLVQTLEDISRVDAAYPVTVSPAFNCESLHSESINSESLNSETSDSETSNSESSNSEMSNSGSSPSDCSLMQAEDANELSKACCQVMSRYGTPAIVQPHCAGQSIAVGLLGCGASAVVLLPAHVDGQLSNLLVRTAQAAWRTVGGCDAGCMTMQCDTDHRPQVLSIDPLPSLAEDSSFMKLARAAGQSLDDVVHRIVQSTAQRTGLDSQRHSLRTHLGRQKSRVSH